MKVIFFLLLAFPMFCRADIDSLFYSARTNNLQAMKVLVQKGVNINSEVVFNWTPLQVASYEGYSEIVHYLVEQGASINAQDVNGVSPLMDAIWGGHTDIAKYLINKGATIDAQIPGQITVYGLAVAKNEYEIVQILKGMRSKEKATNP